MTNQVSENPHMEQAALWGVHLRLLDSFAKLLSGVYILYVKYGEHITKMILVHH